MGNEGAVRGAAVSEIDVQKPVVIHVAKIGAHRHGDLIQAHFLRYILERSVPQVLIELQGLEIMRQPKVAAQDFVDGKERRDCEQVGPAVVIVIENPGGKAPRLRLVREPARRLP